MNPSHTYPLHALSTLSFTDRSGKIVISIIKKHIEEDTSLIKKPDAFTTEIYFLSADTTDPGKIVKLIKH
jgi:hypothetical protein